MPDATIMQEMKSDLKRMIREHANRGFVSYNGCIQVCRAMEMMVENSRKLEDRKLTFDIHLYMLVEVVKLIAYADTSAGSVNDVIADCLNGIEELSKSASDETAPAMFKAVIKTAKSKAFTEWAEFGYGLLRKAVCLVNDRKQAEQVYALFPVLGKMYGDREYPDLYMITHAIVERLDGPDAAARYRKKHLHIREIRVMVVERALAAGQHAEAEKLCLEALRKDKTYGEPSAWAYYLERIYAELGDVEKQIEIVRQILRQGKRSYYARMKALYEAKGEWEQRREPILDELSKAYMSHTYASLLEEEGEWARLLAVVQANPYHIADYGAQLARYCPEDTYRIYEAYIASEAAEASDRRKYKGVCKLIRSYFDAGAQAEARDVIRSLVEKYPRRSAMLDELETLDSKLLKKQRIR